MACEFYIEHFCKKIAANLQVAPSRIRYATLYGQERGKLKSTGDVS